MSFESEKFLLNEIVEVTDYVANGSFASLKENVTYLDGDGYAVLVRLVDSNANWKGERVFVDERAYKFLSKSSLEEGDIVIANVGANAGSVFRVPALAKPATLGPNAVRVRPRSNYEHKLSRDFLYYYLVSPVGQGGLQSIITGSAQPKFNKTALRSLSLLVPSLHIQNSVASLMSSIDDRIALLRDTNSTLEAIAQALYKSWFVDFDPVRAKAEGGLPEGIDAATTALFPDRFVESELGMVPKGWITSNLANESSYLNRGISPKYADKGGVLVLNQKCIRDFSVDFDKGRRHDEAQKKVDEKLLRVGDVLVNSTGVGTLGRVAQILGLIEPAIVDSHVTVIRAGEKINSFYLGELMKSMQSTIESMGEGSTGQTELSRSKLGELKILVPDRKILDLFESIILPLSRASFLNNQQSSTLSKLRDTLLPRLVSGQLRITDAETKLEKAIA